MSTGSWDDSSNLVKELSSPTNNDKEKDEVFNKVTQSPLHVARPPPPDLKSRITGIGSSPIKTKKSKAAKGLGFLLKAREGAKKRSKSPLKSPSKEVLTSELTAEEIAANEKLKEKSEHWQAFMSMQDRIKTNVLKTQTTLLHTSGKSSPTAEEREDHSSPWVHGDNATDSDYQSDSQQVYDNTINDESQHNYHTDQVVPDVNNDFTSVVSTDTDPPFSKNPFKNPEIIRRLSMEQESLTDVLSFENTAEKSESEVNTDPFGLFTENETNINPTPVVVSGDLLGLEDFLGPCNVQPTSGGQDTSSDWFSGYSSSVQSSAQSSLCSSPTGFEQDFLAAPGSTAVSDLARSLVDDFLQWGVETAEKDLEPISTNPFHTPSVPPKGVRVPPTTPDIFDPLKSGVQDSLDGIWGSPSVTNTTPNAFQQQPIPGTSSNIDDINVNVTDASPPNISLNPFAVDTPESRMSEAVNSDTAITDFDGAKDIFGGTPYQPTSIHKSLFDKINSSQSNSPIKIARQPQAKQKKDDPFGALFKAASGQVVEDDEDEPLTLAEMKAKADRLKKTNDTQSDIISNNISSIDIESVSEIKSSDADLLNGQSKDEIMEEVPEKEIDPFSSVPEKDTTTATISQNFDAWESKPFGFSDNISNKRYTQMELDDDDFFSLQPTSKASVEDAWGEIDSGNACQTANPFQDDFFTTDHIPMQTDASELGSKPKNPFLTASFENIAAENKNTQPNLFLGESTFGIDSQNTQPFGSPAKQTAVVIPPNDQFDPFTSKQGEIQEGQTMDLLGTPEKRMSTSDYDNMDDDDKETFKLEIKTSSKPLLETGPTPMLPPPPKAPKSPQLAFRENPFDRDSPPEENFAKFEIVEQEMKTKPPEPRERITSTSTESSTPDDEEDHLPLDDFRTPFTAEGWTLMLRQPTKKKLAGNRFWKNVFVRIAKVKEGIALQIFQDENQKEPFQELPLQPCYAISDLSVQQYDQFGKIHTVKMQYVFYRERVGIRPERITPSFVRKPKATMILDHAPQMSELLKFGSLDENLLKTFVWQVEDAFMKLESHREKTLSYTKDEVTAEVWEEYEAYIDKLGHVKNHKGRVRLFFLAFVTGMPWCELGLNDKRRKGKEVVGRHDIIPVKTEDWINIEHPEFHCSVDLDEYEKSHTIKFHPLDACQFELCRFRVRPKYNRELPLQVRCQQTLKKRHFEIRCDMLVTGYHANTKKHGQFPCEDIEVRFKIPETWIYLFRYEKRFGYGSFKASARKPGKIKGIERITMMAQGALTPTLMEASSGTAKYEHLHKSVVWRISRLPERNQGAYKSHLFVLRLDLGPHDEIPETFDEMCHVHFTMPSSTVSKTQVRSISVDNPNPPEKWVRYLAKYQYEVEIENTIEPEIDEQDASD